MRRMTWLAVMAAVMTGCKSDPTLGDRMISQSEGTQELGKLWNQGNSLVKRGEKSKRNGQDLMQRGQNEIREGDNFIREGRALILQSETAFRSKFPTIPLKEQELARE